MKLNVVLLFFAILLTSCASKYCRVGMASGCAYFDSKRNSEYEVYEIISQCNGYTSANACRDMSLRRASEICSFGFVALDNKDYVQQSKGTLFYTSGSATNMMVYDVEKPSTSLSVLCISKKEAKQYPDYYESSVIRQKTAYLGDEEKNISKDKVETSVGVFFLVGLLIVPFIFLL